ncbi:MAG: type IV toxin-antitoxin system AbiEi family antitoxin domain-containing protein [Lachnospiraceae bacterium]|nr:type IV toxin-antitoxin system AbiEi family antitoxin domain-containing protein [Lachnospiraceae bacterium]
MDRNEALQTMIEENNGYLITSQAVEAGITKPFLSKYIKAHHMEKAAHGIYNEEDVWPDELYIMQMRSKAVIFCGETALFLHGMTDREYSKICVSVPAKYNVSHLKNENIEVRYVQEDIYSLGVCEVKSSSGNYVKAYDMERCICDLIKDRKKYEVQLFQTAMKEYMSNKDKRISTLIEYAEKLGIRDEVMKYVEVLV